uniref:Uncharacterized protein n=1 Tax=Heterorhabditis bacteriophora TaxID=37862 RepID=A0A1I7WFQ4_HETBA
MNIQTNHSNLQLYEEKECYQKKIPYFLDSSALLNFKNKLYINRHIYWYLFKTTGIARSNSLFTALFKKNDTINK